MQGNQTEEIERNSLFSVCTLVEGSMYAYTAFDRIPIQVDLSTENIILLYI